MTLRVSEIYLKPFELIVKQAKPHVIMSGYNSFNGAHMASNKIIDEVLRKTWGFDGAVMSDWAGARANHPACRAHCQRQVGLGH